MWVFTRYGFFSAVCARQGSGEPGQPVDPDRVMVRARVRHHLEALQARFGELLGESEIRVFEATDYAFRIFVDKSVWVQVMAALTEEMDYDNFKSEVGRHQGVKGGRYVGALHGVWDVMYRLQEG
ncbi:MAG: hypothetical protein D8M59_15590 [Planctomycetes bacterium]|nr:hypothetical protein [Planctomycetota bacterium]NOG55547.1 hypothetical protein [Planctomycetota bacterium]